MFGVTVNELGEFMKNNGLESGTACRPIEDPGKLDKLHRHVEMVCSVCQVFTRAEGLDMGKLLGLDGAGAPLGGYSVDQVSKFRDVVEALELTADQVKG